MTRRDSRQSSNIVLDIVWCVGLREEKDENRHVMLIRISFYVIPIKNTFIQKYNNLAKNNFK